MDSAEEKVTAQRLLEACELHELGCEMMKQNLKRRHPELGPEDLRARYLRWLRHRPGAEEGDAPGRVVHDAST